MKATLDAVLKNVLALRKVLRIAVLAMFASCFGCQSLPRHAVDLREPQRAYDELMKEQLFAFGGVGIASMISRGEIAFRTVLKQKDSSQLFKGVFDNGTAAGKLYALCGLRFVDEEAYIALSTVLAKENPPVQRMGGCIIFSENAATVISRIENGEFDRLIGLKKRKRMR